MEPTPPDSLATASAGPPLPEERPVNERQNFGWPFWTVLILMFVLLAAIAIPNFVKARTTACSNACLSNLKHIDGAVQQWALHNHKKGTDAVTTNDILDFLKGSTLPACPANGSYSLSTVSAAPMCTQSANGHSL